MEEKAQKPLVCPCSRGLLIRSEYRTGFQVRKGTGVCEPRHFLIQLQIPWKVFTSSNYPIKTVGQGNGQIGPDFRSCEGPWDVLISMTDSTPRPALNLSFGIVNQTEFSEGSLAQVLQGVSLLLHAVVFLLGISGNSLVLWMAGCKMKRTVGSVFACNLAAADFSFVLFLPFSFAYIAMGHHWPFGRVLCKLCVSVEYLNLFGSIFLLGAISAQRCASAPVWTRNRLNPRAAAWASLVVWALALLATAPYFAFLDAVPSGRRDNRTSCRLNYARPGDPTGGQGRTLQRQRQEALSLARFVLAFLLPFAAIAGSYATIAPQRIMATIVAAFFVGWLPYHVFELLKVAAQPSTAIRLGTTLSYNLILFNSCLNPIIYIFMGHRHRQTLKQSLKAVLERIASE
ncbi:N-formyl peptide receptor 2-like [Heterodontus francisci]|uniref:N-formyl peptide receptor 2-like n=1 Tax=Heterodontus francisci TaxID=7792 RepID=UPI00355C1B78